MKNNSRLKISCRFVIIDSDQDLVLGWQAIKRFNLMKVNIATNQKYNLETRKIKKLQFKDNLINLNSDINSQEKSELDTNVEYLQSCLKVTNSHKQYIDINTFNSLTKFNTHVNRYSVFDYSKIKSSRRRVDFDLISVNNKWNTYYDAHVVNTIEDENAKVFIDDVLANVDVNSAVVISSEFDSDIAACKSHILEVEKSGKHVNLDSCDSECSDQNTNFSNQTNKNIFEGR